MTLHQQSHPPLRLLHLVRAVYRHRGKATWTLLAGLLLVLLAAVWWPRTYVSETRLTVRLEAPRGSDRDDRPPLAAETALQREVNSLQQLLHNRDLLSAVVESVGANRILAVSEPDSAALRERATNCLARSIACTAPRDSNVLTIRCRAGSPELARDLLQAYVDAFVAGHPGAGRHSTTVDYLARQVRQLDLELALAEEQLRTAQDEVGLVSVDGQRRALETQLSNLHLQIMNTQTERASMLARISELRERHPEMSVPDEPAFVHSPQITAGMLREHYKLELQQRDLEAKLPPRHPRLLAVAEQLAASNMLLAQHELATAESQLRMNRARAETLNKRFEEGQARLQALQEMETQIDALSRHVHQLEDRRQNYAGELAQSRMEYALAQQQAPRIAVAQAPSLIPTPTSPHLPTTIILGGLAAVLAAVGISCLADYVDDSFHSPADIERVLEVPVVMSLPSSPGIYSISP